MLFAQIKFSNGDQAIDPRENMNTMLIFSLKILYTHNESILQEQKF